MNRMRIEPQSPVLVSSTIKLPAGRHSNKVSCTIW